MSDRYPPLPASSSPPPLTTRRGRPRGRMSNVPTPSQTPRTILSANTEPGSERSVNIPSPPRIVRTNFPIRLPLRSFTTAANNAVTSRLQENPVIGTNRWVLRSPVPSYSGMDLSQVPSRASSPGNVPYSGINLSAVYSRPTTATAPVPVDRDAVLQKVFEKALENNDERKKDERDAERESKAQSRRILKNEYARGQMDRTAYVDEREAYRQHILSYSLFPNLYNQQMVMTQLGAS